MKGVLVAAFFGALSIFYGYQFLRSWNAGQTSTRTTGSPVTVAFTDATISANYGNGETRSIDWNSITKVGITTSDEGPFVEDVFWGLHAGEEIKVAYPQGANGEQALLRAMQERLVGFDNGQVIEAMGSTSNAHFTVWERTNDGIA